MQNLSDFPGEPPFNVHDIVVSTNPNWSTMKAGRKAFVEQCYWSRTRRKWIITVNHPRFGLSDYNAEWFKLHRPSMQAEEKREMHIAIDISDNKKLDEAQVQRMLLRDDTYLCQDRSLATVKNIVKEALQKDPERSFAIFSLAYIAEVDQPQPPVRFRDMR